MVAVENAFWAFSKDLVGACCASTGPATSTGLFVSARGSHERRTNRFAQWKGKHLHAVPFHVVHHQLSPMGEQRRLDIVAREPLPHKVRPRIEADLPVGIDFLNPGHVPARDRQVQHAAMISIVRQGEAARQRAQLVPVEPQPLARPSRPVGAASQGAMDFLLVIEAPMRQADAPHGAQIGTGVPQHVFLPAGIETLDEGIAPRLAEGQKDHVDAEQQMDARDQGQAVRVFPPPVAAISLSICEIRGRPSQAQASAKCSQSASAVL